MGSRGVMAMVMDMELVRVITEHPRIQNHHDLIS